MKRITTESSCRWDVGQELGELGGKYEFDIKVPKIHGVDMTDGEFEMEAEDALRDFQDLLLRRYSWIGDTYQTGRSGGWLCIEDAKGGATKAKLQTIIRLIETRMENFIKYLKAEYPAR